MKFVFGFFLLFSFGYAEIIQIQSINQCQEYIQPEMLLIFDIDNTIMEPVQLLGSDQWLSYQIQQNLKHGMSEQESVMVGLVQWTAVQNQTKVKLVEPVTAEFISRYQKRGWKVMALTTRGLEMASRTIDQLKSIGIDFAESSPMHQEVVFHDIPGCIYRSGILFSSGSSKGNLLLRFLQQNKLQPKKIFFVDDKEKYLIDVEKICIKQHIPFLGIRYGFLDEKVKNFRPEIAREEWKCFGNLISDREAETHLSEEVAKPQFRS